HWFCYILNLQLSLTPWLCNTPTDGFTQTSVESSQMSSKRGTAEVSYPGTTTTIDDDAVMQMGQALIQQTAPQLVDKRIVQEDPLQEEVSQQYQTVQEQPLDKTAAEPDASAKSGRTEERGCSPITVLEARPEVDQVTVRPLSRGSSHTITTTTSWGAPVSTTTNIQLGDNESAHCVQFTLHSESRVTLHAPGEIWDELRHVKQGQEEQQRQQQPEQQDSTQKESRGEVDNKDDITTLASITTTPKEQTDKDISQEDTSQKHLKSRDDDEKVEELQAPVSDASGGRDITSSVTDSQAAAAYHDIVGVVTSAESISEFRHKTPDPSKTVSDDVIESTRDTLHDQFTSSNQIDSVKERLTSSEFRVQTVEEVSERVSQSPETAEVVEATAKENVSKEDTLSSEETIDKAIISVLPETVVEEIAQSLVGDITSTECEHPAAISEDPLYVASEITAPSAHRPTTLMITSNSNESTDDAECTTNDPSKIGRENDIPRDLSQEGSSMVAVEESKQQGMGTEQCSVMSERLSGSEGGAVPRTERPVRPAPRTTTLVKVKVEKRPVGSHPQVRERIAHEHQTVVRAPSVEEEVRGLMQEVKEATSQIKQEVKELRQADTPTPDTPTPLREFKEFLNREEEQEQERLPTIKEMCRESEEDASVNTGGEHPHANTSFHLELNVPIQECSIPLQVDQPGVDGTHPDSGYSTLEGHSAVSVDPSQATKYTPFFSEIVPEGSSDEHSVKSELESPSSPVDNNVLCPVDSIGSAISQDSKESRSKLKLFLNKVRKLTSRGLHKSESRKVDGQGEDLSDRDSEISSIASCETESRETSGLIRFKDEGLKSSSYEYTSAVQPAAVKKENTKYYEKHEPRIGEQLRDKISLNPFEEFYVDSVKEIVDSPVKDKQISEMGEPSSLEMPHTEDSHTKSPVSEFPLTEVPNTESPVTELSYAKSPVSELPQIESPVSELPQIESPVSELPQIESPVSELPQIESPVSELPSIESPGSELPSIESPGSELPSTDSLVSELPHTESSVSEFPSTGSPVSELPSTDSLVSELPHTESPVPELPSTDSPVSELPHIESPVSELPHTESPVSELPHIESPVSELPHIESPVSELPHSESPVSELPHSESPVSELPHSESPVSELPHSESPVSELPYTESPVPELPFTKPPVSKLPHIESPVSDLPHTESPVPELPSTKPPVSKLPHIESPVSKLPHSESPVSELPHSESPVSELPHSESPVSELPHSESPVSELPHTESPVPELPITKPPVSELPHIESPVSELPHSESPVSELPYTESPVPELPITKPPVSELPHIESPVSELPHTESPVPELPSTKPPVSKLPHIESPVSKLPHSESPVSELPHSESPVPELPSTKPPVLELSHTEVTYTESTVSELPHTEVPYTESTVSELPHTEVPYTESTVSDLPHTEVLYTESTVSDLPLTEVLYTESSELKSLRSSIMLTDSVVSGVSAITPFDRKSQFTITHDPEIQSTFEYFKVRKVEGKGMFTGDADDGSVKAGDIPVELSDDDSRLQRIRASSFTEKDLPLSSLCKSAALYPSSEMCEEEEEEEEEEEDVYIELPNTDVVEILETLIEVDETEDGDDLILDDPGMQFNIETEKEYEEEQQIRAQHGRERDSGVRIKVIEVMEPDSITTEDIDHDEIQLLSEADTKAMTEHIGTFETPKSEIQLLSEAEFAAIAESMGLTEQTTTEVGMVKNGDMKNIEIPIGKSHDDAFYGLEPGKAECAVHETHPETAREVESESGDVVASDDGSRAQFIMEKRIQEVVASEERETAENKAYEFKSFITAELSQETSSSSSSPVVKRLKRMEHVSEPEEGTVSSAVTQKQMKKQIDITDTDDPTSQMKGELFPPVSSPTGATITPDVEESEIITTRMSPGLTVEMSEGINTEMKVTQQFASSLINEGTLCEMDDMKLSTLEFDAENVFTYDSETVEIKECEAVTSDKSDIIFFQSVTQVNEVDEIIEAVETEKLPSFQSAVAEQYKLGNVLKEPEKFKSITSAKQVVVYEAQPESYPDLLDTAGTFESNESIPMIDSSKETDADCGVQEPQAPESEMDLTCSDDYPVTVPEVEGTDNWIKTIRAYQSLAAKYPNPDEPILGDREPLEEPYIHRDGSDKKEGHGCVLPMMKDRSSAPSKDKTKKTSVLLSDCKEVLLPVQDNETIITPDTEVNTFDVKEQYVTESIVEAFVEEPEAVRISSPTVIDDKQELPSRVDVEEEKSPHELPPLDDVSENVSCEFVEEVCTKSEVGKHLVEAETGSDSHEAESDLDVTESADISQLGKKLGSEEQTSPATCGDTGTLPARCGAGAIRKTELGLCGPHKDSCTRGIKREHTFVIEDAVPEYLKEISPKQEPVEVQAYISESGFEGSIKEAKISLHLHTKDDLHQEVKLVKTTLCEDAQGYECESSKSVDSVEYNQNPQKTVKVVREQELESIVETKPDNLSVDDSELVKLSPEMSCREIDIGKEMVEKEKVSEATSLTKKEKISLLDSVSEELKTMISCLEENLVAGTSRDIRIANILARLEQMEREVVNIGSISKVPESSIPVVVPDVQTDDVVSTSQASPSTEQQLEVHAERLDSGDTTCSKAKMPVGSGIEPSSLNLSHGPSPGGEMNGQDAQEALTDVEDIFSDGDQTPLLKRKTFLMAPQKDTGALTDTEDMDLSGDEDDIIQEKKNIPTIQELGLLPDPVKEIINLTEGYARRASPLLQSDSEPDDESVQGRHKKNIMKVGKGDELELPEDDVAEGLTDVEDMVASGDEEPSVEVEDSLPDHYMDQSEGVSDKVKLKSLSPAPKIFLTKDGDSSDDETQHKKHPRHKSKGSLKVATQEGGTTDVEDLVMSDKGETKEMIETNKSKEKVQRKKHVRRKVAPKKHASLTLTTPVGESSGLTDTEILTGDEDQEELESEDLGLTVPEVDPGTLTDSEDVEVSDTEEVADLVAKPVDKTEVSVIPDPHCEKIKISEVEEPVKEESGGETDEEGFELNENEDARPWNPRQNIVYEPIEVVVKGELDVEEAYEPALTDTEDLDIDEKEEEELISDIASRIPEEGDIYTIKEMETYNGRVTKKEMMRDVHAELMQQIKDAEMAGLTLQEAFEDNAETDVEDLEDNDQEKSKVKVKVTRGEKSKTEEGATDEESIDESDIEEEVQETPKQVRRKGRRLPLVPQVSEVRFVETEQGPLSIIITPDTFEKNAGKIIKDQVANVVFLEQEDKETTTDVEDLSDGEGSSSRNLKMPRNKQEPTTDTEDFDVDPSEVYRPHSPLPPHIKFDVLQSPKREIIHIKEDKYGVPQVTVQKLQKDELVVSDIEDLGATDTEDIEVSEEEALRLVGVTEDASSDFEIPEAGTTEVISKMTRKTQPLHVEPEEEGGTDVEELPINKKPRRKARSRSKLIPGPQGEDSHTDVEILSDSEDKGKLVVRIASPGDHTDVEDFETSGPEDLEDATREDAPTPDIIRDAAIRKMIVLKEGPDGSTYTEEAQVAPDHSNLLGVEGEPGGVTDVEDMEASGVEDEIEDHPAVDLPDYEATSVGISEKTSIPSGSNEAKHIKDNLLLPEDNFNNVTDVESLGEGEGNRCASNTGLLSGQQLTYAVENCTVDELLYPSLPSTDPKLCIHPGLSLESDPFCGELTKPLVVEAELEQVYYHAPQEQPQETELELEACNGCVIRRRQVVASSCQAREVRRFWSQGRNSPLQQSEINDFACPAIEKQGFKTILYLEQPNLLDTISISDTLCDSNYFKNERLLDFDSSSIDSYDDHFSYRDSDIVTVVDRFNQERGSSLDDLPSPHLSSICSSAVDSLCSGLSFSSDTNVNDSWCSSPQPDITCSDELEKMNCDSPSWTSGTCTPVHSSSPVVTPQSVEVQISERKNSNLDYFETDSNFHVEEIIKGKILEDLLPDSTSMCIKQAPPQCVSSGGSVSNSITTKITESISNGKEEKPQIMTQDSAGSFTHLTSDIVKTPPKPGQEELTTKSSGEHKTQCLDVPTEHMKSNSLGFDKDLSVDGDSIKKFTDERDNNIESPATISVQECLAENIKKFSREWLSLTGGIHGEFNKHKEKHNRENMRSASARCIEEQGLEIDGRPLSGFLDRYIPQTRERPVMRQSISLPNCDVDSLVTCMSASAEARKQNLTEILNDDPRIPIPFEDDSGVHAYQNSGSFTPSLDSANDKLTGEGDESDTVSLADSVLGLEESAALCTRNYSYHDDFSPTCNYGQLLKTTMLPTCSQGCNNDFIQKSIHDLNNDTTMVIINPAPAVPVHWRHTLPRVYRQVKDQAKSSTSRSLNDGIKDSQEIVKDFVGVKGLIEQWEEIVEEEKRRSLPASPALGRKVLPPFEEKKPARRTLENEGRKLGEGENKKTVEGNVSQTLKKTEHRENTHEGNVVEEVASVCDIIQKFEVRVGRKDKINTHRPRLHRGQSPASRSPSHPRRVATVKPLCEPQMQPEHTDAVQEVQHVVHNQESMESPLMAGFVPRVMESLSITKASREAQEEDPPLARVPNPEAPSIFGKRQGIESFFYKGFFLPPGNEDLNREAWSNKCLAIMFERTSAFIDPIH
ncbi:Translation initiation factor IF-2-like 2, partial [Homarus americanus]